MKFYSTNRKSVKVDFKETLMQGLAPDGGLFMPKFFPKLAKDFLRNINKKSFQQIALEISKKFIADIPEKELKRIIKESFNFKIPLVRLGKNLYILELFHGPTLAFKDFGARFMARVMGYYLSRKRRAKSEELNIIVATSGDTGSAVASGFFNVPHIKVFILYPSKKVSVLQEKQLTTFGGNITTFEVRGSFDDCQKLAKQILANKELKKKINLSSANSINFGRLLPQSFYYFYAYARFKRKATSDKRQVIFCVPSGNFGNLTAGLMAKKMGLPVSKFIAATNANDVVPQYLKTGKFVSRISRKTISNAMDVGNPSNWARIRELYDYDHDNDDDKIRKNISKDIEAIAVSETETKKTIREIYKKYGYIIDPHTAVGVTAAKKSSLWLSSSFVILATAHPAKFKDIVELLIGKQIALPPQLKSAAKNKKKSIKIKNNLSTLKKFILKNK